MNGRTAMHLILGLILGFVPLAAAGAGDPAPVQIMVLGTYHMGNPGLDLHNARADDVLTPARQAQLEAVATTLATFEPTLIAVERVTAAPDYRDPHYATFDGSQLATQRDERVQVGYRLARLAGLEVVQGIDEQPGTGEPDYFPFDRVQAAAKRNGTEAALTALTDRVGRAVAEFERRQAGSTIAELLIDANDPRHGADASFYYGLLVLDSGEDQPGAELLGYWTMRNAKIFAKLLDVVRPGDRVIVVYGSGHKHWLEQLVRDTPGFELVDPVPYLRR